MKKNNTIFVIAGLGILLTIASCNKEQMEPGTTNNSEIAIANGYAPDTEAQREFLASLRRAVSETTVRDIDPVNAYNMYDFYGQYFSTMINWLLDNFDLQSLNYDDYIGIVNDYMQEHPLPTFDWNYALSETDLELVKISRQIVGNQDLSVEEKIAQLKLMEDMIAETSLFSEASKEIVLISLSISKHLSSIGLTDPVGPSAFTTCFDNEFDSCMHDRMDALFNTQNVDFNLVDTVFYCGGLPVNVAQDVVACAWDAAWAC